MKNILLTLLIFFIYLQAVVAQQYSNKIKINTLNESNIFENTDNLNVENIADNPNEVIVLQFSLGLADSSHKFIYTYNNSSTLDTEIYQTYDTTLGFINKFKTTYTYNSKGIDVRTYNYFQNAAWEPIFEYRYQYDLNGNLINIKSFSLPSLKPLGATFYYYDNQNFLLAKSNYVSNQTNNILNVKDSTIYVNNSLGNVITAEFLLKELAGFRKSTIKEHFYDSMNRLDYYLIKSYDLSTLAYTNLYQRIFSYQGSQERYKNFVDKIWDVNQYNNSYKETNEFINNKIDYILREDFANGIYTPFTKIIYKYKSTGINEINNSNLKSTLFPNPSNSSFTYSILITDPESASISISDISGRLVYQLENLQLNQGENIFSLNPKLIKGIYSVKLTTSTSIDIKKLIIN